MTVANTIPCPHCGAANVTTAAFCEACGKALPSMTQAGPRVVSAEALPQSALGQRLVGDELVKQQKKATTALLAVAIIQTVVGPIILTILSQSQRQPTTIPPIIWVVQFGVAAIFWVLWFWSRKSPLPATIVGLILYVTLVVLNVIAAVGDLAADPEAPRRGLGGVGIGILDIIIIVILAQAIGAGVKHKRLMQTEAGA